MKRGRRKEKKWKRGREEDEKMRREEKGARG